MKLIVANYPEPSIWNYDHGKVTRFNVDLFEEHDLCYESTEFKMFLPLEVQLKIFSYLFNLYIETRNFDLVCELVTVNTLVAKQIYNQIFGKSDQTLVAKTTRVIHTMSICQQIYEYFLCAKRCNTYSAIRLIREPDPIEPTNLRIWEFNHGMGIDELRGIIYDQDNNIFNIDLGRNYGTQVWITGTYCDGLWDCSDIQTPIINIILSDQNDILLSTEDRLKKNKSVQAFASILRQAYGPRTAINFMIREDNDEDNPFLTMSNYFYSF